MSITFCETDNRFLNKPLPDVNILALINVNPEDRDYIRVVDTHDSGLVCLHYLVPLDSKGAPDLNILSRVGHVRGIVVDTTTNKVVCKSFPYTVEMVVDPAVQDADSGTLSGSLGQPPSLAGERVAYEAKEGTIIRRYFAAGHWRASTHRKIDSTHSRWAGPSFGKVFEDLFALSEAGLNPDLCYMFMISHPQNKLIYNVSEPKLVHITTYDPQTDLFHDPSELGYEAKGVSTPKKLEYNSLKELSDLVNTAKTADFSGVILLDNFSKPMPVKLVSQKYVDIKNIRGNEPSLRKRYLQLRSTPQAETLVNWYEESQDVFNGVEKDIQKLAKKLHLAYLDRFINKLVVQIPKEEFVFLSKCHSWHIENRASNIVTIDVVRRQLNATPYYYVDIMLGRL